MKLLKRFSKSQLLGFLSFLILWEAVHLLLRTHTVPSPWETIVYSISRIDKLALHSLASLLRILTGIGISMVIGIPIGIYLGVSQKFGYLFSPFLYFIYPIPKIAFLPVFMLLFGLGDTSKVILIIWIIIFQIIISVRDGIAQIPKIQYKVMDSFQASAFQKYRFLIIPAILPHIFTGLRISIGISLASLFFAENYATVYGIGYYIISAWTKMNYVEMFSGIMTIGILGVILYQILDEIELKVAPWNK
ncbi:MAG: ABC transporter permease [Clostridiaceae bacterium]|nr:ABC transporter permease [Clostridiaceae bacterium]